MEFREITDMASWEEFIKNHPDGTFLQSWKFGEVNGALGDKVMRFGLYRGDNILKGAALIVRVKARRGDFLYLPYGPLILENDLFPELVAFLKDLARKEKVRFIRVSPYSPDTPEIRELFMKHGFRPAPLHMLAEHLWLLDLKDVPEEQLLSHMEKKHRNLIRRAEKDGVKIRTSTNMSDVDAFITLHDETVKRHSFTPYPKDYFRNQVKLFGKHDEALVFSAEYQGKLLASAIIMFYGGTASYHHGASSSDPEYRKIPASYLLQWAAIKEAKKRGCCIYNFWGIAPDENSRHPFFGITHFKKGFGGRRYDLLHCQDLPVSPLYWITFLIETVRKWKRGF